MRNKKFISKKKKNNVEKDSIEELAIDEFYERGDF